MSSLLPYSDDEHNDKDKEFQKVPKRIHQCKLALKLNVNLSGLPPMIHTKTKKGQRQRRNAYKNQRLLFFFKAEGSRTSNVTF